MQKIRFSTTNQANGVWCSFATWRCSTPARRKTRRTTPKLLFYLLHPPHAGALMSSHWLLPLCIRQFAVECEQFLIPSRRSSSYPFALNAGDSCTEDLFGLQLQLHYYYGNRLRCPILKLFPSFSYIASHF